MPHRSTPAEQTLPAHAAWQLKAAAWREDEAARLRAEAELDPRYAGRKLKAAQRREDDAAKLRASADGKLRLWSMYQAGLRQGRAEVSA
jgi:hypothetical protein